MKVLTTIKSLTELDIDLIDSNEAMLVLNNLANVQILNGRSTKDDDDDEEEDSDIYDGENDTNAELSDFREIKDLIKNTINPIKDIDEFKSFSELLIFLKNNKNDIYSRWENTLDQNRKDEVSKLFSTKRINLQINKDNTVQVPRRIVTIKRNFNNNNNQ